VQVNSTYRLGVKAVDPCVDSGAVAAAKVSGMMAGCAAASDLSCRDPNAFAVLRLRPMEQVAPLRAVPAPITDP